MRAWGGLRRVEAMAGSNWLRPWLCKSSRPISTVYRMICNKERKEKKKKKKKKENVMSVGHYGPITGSVLLPCCLDAYQPIRRSPLSLQSLLYAPLFQLVSLSSLLYIWDIKRKKERKRISNTSIRRMWMWVEFNLELYLQIYQRINEMDEQLRLEAVTSKYKPSSSSSSDQQSTGSVGSTSGRRSPVKPGTTTTTAAAAANNNALLVKVHWMFIFIIIPLCDVIPPSISLSSRVESNYLRLA